MQFDCLVCGGQKGSRKRYCEHCFSVAMRQQWAFFDEQRRAAKSFGERWRGGLAKKSPGRLRDVRCAWCETPFSQRSPWQFCCCDECFRLFSQKRRKETPKAKVKANCKICSAEFTKSNPRQECCSGRCRTINRQIASRRAWQAIKSDKAKLDNYRKYKRGLTASQRSTPEGRLLKRLRSRLYGVAKRLRASGGKLPRESGKSLTKELLGCSLSEFKAYIESKFKRGMSWDNFGLWHIDHVVPISVFNPQSSGDLRRCFHFTNMQPLWGTDNLIKGDRVGVIQQEFAI